MSAFIKPNAFGQENIPSEKKPISSYESLFVRDQNVPYKNIYIEANAGYGKTSFTQKLALTWCQAQQPNKSLKCKFKQEDVDTLKCFDLLFLLHLRDFQGDQCHIDDLIFKFVSQNLPDKEQFSKQFIVKLLQKKTCLVIFDGLDEWVHPETCTQTPGIPHNNYHENCTVLITTRPWKLSTIGLQPNMIDRQVEISVLDKITFEELKSNAVKLLNENKGEENQRDLTDFDRNVSLVKLGKIRYIPYILLQLICIWFDGHSIGSSTCETYSNTIQLTLERGLKRKTVSDLPTKNTKQNIIIPECIRKNELCNRYVSLLLKLGKLAFFSFFCEILESKIVIGRTTVLGYLAEQELAFCLEIGLLSQTKDITKVAVKQYKVFFQHKSVQEYMAAFYIASEWKNETENLTPHILKACLSLASILEMSELFVFVCGMDPEVYECISYEFQKIVERDSVTCRYRTNMDIDHNDDTRTVESYQSMQVRCFQESMRNGNEHCSIYLQDILFYGKNPGGNYWRALKTIEHFNEGNVKSLQLVSSEKTIPAFMQSLDPSLFTSLHTLRVDSDEEPVWFAKILHESHHTLKCFTRSARSTTLSDLTLTALKELKCLQSLFLNKVTISYTNLERLYNYISQTTTLTQLKLNDIDCADHCNSFVSLDLHSMNEMKTLDISYALCQELHINSACLEKLMFRPNGMLTANASTSFWKNLDGAKYLASLELHKLNIAFCNEIVQPVHSLTQLRYLKLKEIDMRDGILCFSSEMTKLESVELDDVNMSSEAWEVLFPNAGKLPQLQDLKLHNINMGVGIPRFSTALINIEHVELYQVTMSSTAWKELFNSVNNVSEKSSITFILSWITMTVQEWRELFICVSRLLKSITVELVMCQGPSEKDWKTVVDVIKSTPTISLMQDLCTESFGGNVVYASLTLIKH